MNRELAIKEILERILEERNKVTNLSKSEIEKAIILSRGVDSRTIRNWFNTLWKLEYLTQPKAGSYNLNLVKVSQLEISVAHTHFLERR